MSFSVSAIRSHTPGKRGLARGLRFRSFTPGRRAVPWLPSKGGGFADHWFGTAWGLEPPRLRTLGPELGWREQSPDRWQNLPGIKENRSKATARRRSRRGLRAAL